MEDKDRVRHKGHGTVMNRESWEEVWKGIRDAGLWKSEDGSIGTSKLGERDAGDMSMAMG